MDQDKYLLVLTVLEGKNFPSRNQFNLVIEAKFDGLSMLTDPVEHISNPHFGTDLGWEVDRKSMHLLKIARTPVKISCVATNIKNSIKENVGYIIMDSRMANFTLMKPKWFPILNSKYTPRPELLLTLYMEFDGKPDLGTPKEKQKTPTRKPTAKSSITYDVTELKPILNDTEGYYQIGPSETCNEFFTLSITIGFAANLEQLIPSASILPTNHRGFFFYYSLMGNDISTDPFPDLVKAEFAPERASIKLKSSVPALQTFFNTQPGIQVHLCCDEISLGSTDISVKDLLKQSSTEIFMRPITIENSYELKTSRQSQIYDSFDVIKPVVGVVLTIKKEEEALINRVEPVKPNSSVKHTTSEGNGASLNVPATPPTRRNLKYPQSPPVRLDSGLKSKRHEDIIISSSDSESSKNETDAMTDDVGNTESESQNEGFLQLPSVATLEAGGSNTSKSVDMHKYDLLLNLKTIKNVAVPFDFNCFLRYSYLYFGNQAPILTHPTVVVETSGNLVYLPNGITLFSFATAPSQLQDIFSKHPISVEVLHRDSATSQELLLGKSVINLGHLIKQEKSHTINDNGKMIWRQNHSQNCMVRNPSNQPIAELQVCLTLDDFGTGVDVTSRNSVGNVHIGLRRPVSPASNVPKPQKNVYEEQQIAETVALELEQWKEWQEQKFLKELKDKETRHIKDLTAEYTRRETEREIVTKRQLSEYQELQAKLKRVLANLENRDRELLNKESEGQRLKENLQAEYDRHVQDIKDSSRRMKEDCAHKVELERDKNRILHEQILKLQKQLSETANKLEKKETEFYAYRETHSNPKLEIQSNLNLLLIEKTEMERKINALTKSKVHYKQQYGRTLKELARIKSAMQKEAQAQLSKQQTELEEMKLQLFASQQKENIKDEQQALHNLRLQIQSAPERNNGMPSRLENIIGLFDSRAKGALSKIDDQLLTNLMEEKEELFKTGTYEADDPLILDIDKQMRSIIMKNRR